MADTTATMTERGCDSGRGGCGSGGDVDVDGKGVYFDTNATTPVAPEVKQAIAEALEVAWGNPSSSHSAGVAAKKMIDAARKHTAEVVGAQAGDIVFTSGGTESNNVVIYSALEHFRRRNRHAGAVPHIVTTNIEHDSVEKMLLHLEQRGEVELTRVPVDHTTCAVDVAHVLDALGPTTCLVTIMLANNETGVIQPVAEVFQRIRANPAQAHVLLHTDAAQVIGKIPVSVDELHADYLSIVGHKFYAPRNGALYVHGLGQASERKDSAPLYPIFFGGGQERDYRPGTENTPMIAGLGEACRLVCRNIGSYRDHMREMRDYLLQRLQETFGEHAIAINGPSEGLATVLPNTLNFSILSSELTGREILQRVPNIRASVGSACHSHNVHKPSKILLAVGISHDQARKAMRWSVGRDTSKADVDVAVEQLAEAVLQPSTSTSEGQA